MVEMVVTDSWNVLEFIDVFLRLRFGNQTGIYNDWINDFDLMLWNICIGPGSNPERIFIIMLEAIFFHQNQGSIIPITYHQIHSHSTHNSQASTTRAVTTKKKNRIGVEFHCFPIDKESIKCNSQTDSTLSLSDTCSYSFFCEINPNLNIKRIAILRLHVTIVSN